MRRFLIYSVAFVALFDRSAFSARPVVFCKTKISRRIAAASRLLAGKYESWRQQARAQKLTFLKRRRFIRGCVKGSQ